MMKQNINNTFLEKFNEQILKIDNRNLNFDSGIGRYNYVNDFQDKYSKGLIEKGPDFVWNLIKEKVNQESVSDPKIIELAMTSLIFKDNAKQLIQYLKLDKVPSFPIDTKFDTGRRFFYLLKIINKRSGYLLSKPYLDGLTCHRPQEFRFLGGIFYGALSLNKARFCFENAIEKSDPFSLNYFYHKHLFHNYILCLSYLDLDKKLSYFLLKNSDVLNSFGSSYLVNRVRLMELVKSNNIKSVPRLFEEQFKLPIDQVIEGSISNLNLQLSYFSKAGDVENIKKFTKIYMKNLMERVEAGVADPTRVIGYLKYIFSLGGFSQDEMFNFIGESFSYYPFYPVDFKKCLINPKEKITFGKSNNTNFLFPKVEEYQINGVRGIGFNKEIKLIYNLLLAGNLGMSFEELSYYVNGEHDIAGLLLINDRVKQLILRVRKIYGIKIERRNYRAYLSLEDRSKFYINSESTLSLQNSFSKKDFMDYYGVSEFTAKNKLKELLSLGNLKVSLVNKKNIYTKLNT